MSCRRVKKLLVPFLEGELGVRHKQDVESHLKACPGCRKERDLFLESWQALDNYIAPRPADDFTPSLMRKIHSEQTKIIKVAYRFPQFSFRSPAPVLFSFMIAVLAFSLFLNSRIDRGQSAKTAAGGPQGTVIADTDIIQNLELYEEAELLEDLKLIRELDVVENLKDPAS